jgi:hypothetical protein
MRRLLTILTAAALLSCGDAGGGASQTPTMPTRADLTGAKAVFVSSRSGLARQAVDDALFMIDANGDIQPVAFTDAQGEAVDLTVSGEVRNLARTFLTFNFALAGRTRNADDEQYAALVELATGKVYDFSGKDVQSVSIIGKKEALYKNDITAPTPLYYLNLNTLTAVQLNIPQQDDGGRKISAIGLRSNAFGQYYQYDDIDNEARIPQKNNTIIVLNGHIISDNTVDELYIYDLTLSNPPAKFTGTLFYNFSNSQYMDIRNNIPIITLNKTLYSFRINEKDIVVNKDGIDIGALVGANITGINEILNTQVSVFYNYADMYIYRTGILFINPTSDDEDITYSWIAKDLSFLFERNDALYFSINRKVYYISGNTIKVANPETDGAYSVYFNGDDFGAVRVWMVGEDVYFTKYNTATNLLTCVLHKDETTPTTISASEIEMQNITELSF